MWSSDRERHVYNKRTHSLTSDVLYQNSRGSNYYSITSKLSIVAMKLPFFTSVLMMAAVALGCGSQRRATDDAPTFAPIPNGDESIPIGPGGWGIQPFGKGAYMVTEGFYQGIYFRPAIEIGLYS